MYLPSDSLYWMSSSASLMICAQHHPCPFFVIFASFTYPENPSCMSTPSCFLPSTFSGTSCDLDPVTYSDSPSVTNTHMYLFFPSTLQEVSSMYRDFAFLILPTRFLYADPRCIESWCMMCMTSPFVTRRLNISPIISDVLAAGSLSTVFM